MKASGLTLIELLTILVALVVVAAVAIPLWQSRDLQSRRAEAMDALVAIQRAQDDWFAAHARYADAAALAAEPPQGIGLSPTSSRGNYEIELQTAADGLSYVAIARIVRDAGKPDARCAEYRVNHHGRRTATNDEGTDTSRDCWIRR